MYSKTWWFDTCLLSCFPLLFWWLSVSYMFALPDVGDPMEYAAPTAWGSTFHFFPWLDRIMTPIGIRIVSFFTADAATAAPAYMLLINLGTISLALSLAYRLSGFFAAACVGTFLTTSLLFLGLSTYVYTDQTVAFYALLTYSVYDSLRGNREAWATLLCGMLCAVVGFSKVTGVSIVFFFFLTVASRRSVMLLWRFCVGLVIGAICVLLLFALVFNFDSVWNTIGLFLAGQFTKNRPNFVSYADDVLVSFKFFPFIGLFVVLGAYVHEKSRRFLLAAWCHILFLMAIYAVTPNGGRALPHYIYTAYVFTVTGIAVYLGEQTKRYKLPEEFSQKLLSCSAPLRHSELRSNSV